jgi:hypothetical protein
MTDNVTTLTPQCLYHFKTRLYTVNTHSVTYSTVLHSVPGTYIYSNDSKAGGVQDPNGTSLQRPPGYI